MNPSGNSAQQITVDLLPGGKDHLERLAVAAESIASSITSVVSDGLKIALIYPWSNDPSVVRAVLLHGPEDERRLTEALPRFDSGKFQAGEDRSPLAGAPSLRDDSGAVVRGRAVRKERRAHAEARA